MQVLYYNCIFYYVLWNCQPSPFFFLFLRKCVPTRETGTFLLTRPSLKNGASLFRSLVFVYLKEKNDKKLIWRRKQRRGSSRRRRGKIKNMNIKDFVACLAASLAQILTLVSLMQQEFHSTSKTVYYYLDIHLSSLKLVQIRVRGQVIIWLKKSC